MNILKEFLKEIKKGKSNFLLSNEQEAYVFTTVAVGECKVVYGSREFGPISNIAAPYVKLSPVAYINKEGSVLIVDKLSVFRLLGNEELPDGVVFSKDAFNAEKARLKREVFQPFMDKLGAAAVLTEQEIGMAHKEARRQLLDPIKDTDDDDDGDDLYLPSYYDFVSSLFGEVDLRQYVLDRLEKYRDYFEKRKAVQAEIDSFKNSPEVATENELGIAKALESVPEAKTLLVEFEMNGVTDEARVETYVLANILVSRDYFSEYNFTSTKRGRELLDKLGAYGSLRGKRPLLCEDITKISYKGNLLYERSIK